MKPLTAAEVERILAANGFSRSHGSGSHRGWVNVDTGRFAVVPHHGSRTLPQGTLLSIFRQAGIKPPQR